MANPDKKRARASGAAQGPGQGRPLPKIALGDPYLLPYAERLSERMRRARDAERRLTGGRTDLADFASGHEYFGLHFSGGRWVFREWAPNAAAVLLTGDFNGWRETPDYALERVSDAGVWERTWPAGALRHGQLYKLRMRWSGGGGDRLPAWGRRMVQDAHTRIFCAQVWNPPEPHAWRIPRFRRNFQSPLIYETHVGMAQEEGRVGTFAEFRERMIPRIADAGYNTIQLMAVQEHPYYGSFGYHVTNFFALSSRFGTPEEFKALVDAAHEAGLAVIMDIVHSHAAKNEVEGISRFDGTLHQFFHQGPRGNHELWDSRCFNYGKSEVLHFLLSNCRFWLDEYNLDGFRFDGITSMLYFHHGLGSAFTSYDQYFDGVDEDAVSYLALANKVIHSVRPGAITVAEDVSGMPGLAAPLEKGGAGFDYRLAMGVPDYWIKLIKHKRDEDWHVGALWHELTNRRHDEKTVSYAESHDQALVGDQTLIFRLIGSDMYTRMSVRNPSLAVERGLALHKMIRLVTLGTAGHGYLNFMGNEFGHPEWIDFPREGNNWSYHYARRQWSLRDDPLLSYRFLADFDREMLVLSRLFRLLDHQDLRHLSEHCDDATLAFERAGLLFLFNFHPSKSFADYPVAASPGEYQLILDTDAKCFGGQGRLAPNQRYVSMLLDSPPGPGIRVYLPARTAIVLYKPGRPG
ncbi:MAG: 1,4-alpha-glucan-branching enzyme [Lentisphaerae bacterium]|nr:1,4-alpha-glucan-branching enzyme [Lentisphaerota bacterium]